MATRKVKKVAPPAASSPKPTEAKPVIEAFFPYARYISIVGVHTSLLVFVALFLPRAGFADFSSPATARSRPRRNGVVMLTENPLRTIGWMCFGALILQVWWGSWVRHWALDGIASVSMKEKENESATEQSEDVKKSERRLKQRELHADTTQVCAFHLLHT